METKRIFKGKSVDMLVCCSTLIDHAIDNQAYLQERRADWADPYFPTIKNRINSAFQNILGVNNVENLKATTRNVNSIQHEAMMNLGDFKVQLQVGYGSDKDHCNTILQMLGITRYYSDVQKQSQEATIQLLYTFKANMTAELKAELISIGIPEALIDTLIEMADALKLANQTQEHTKGTNKVLNQKDLAELNAIYHEVIGIAKIARRFYTGNKTKQELFSYNKIISNLKQTKGSKEVAE